jgi:hypothetical protein
MEKEMALILPSNPVGLSSQNTGFKIFPFGMITIQDNQLDREAWTYHIQNEFKYVSCDSLQIFT